MSINTRERTVNAKPVDGTWHASPVIDREAFDRIVCNRCGYCCRRITISMGDKGALGMINSYVAVIEVERRRLAEYDPKWHKTSVEISKPTGVMAWFMPQDAMLFMGQLIPNQDADGEWTYRCGHYDDIEGCTIYEDRPSMCVKFPHDEPSYTYGKNRGNPEGCTWDVDLWEFDVVMAASPVRWDGR